MATIFRPRGVEPLPGRNRRSSTRCSSSTGSTMSLLDAAESYKNSPPTANDRVLKPPAKRSIKPINRQVPRFVLQTKGSPSNQSRPKPNLHTSSTKVSDGTYDRPKTQHVPGSYRSNITSESWDDIDTFDAIWRGAGDNTAIALSLLETNMKTGDHKKSPTLRAKIVPEPPIKAGLSSPLESDLKPNSLKSLNSMRSEPAPNEDLDPAGQVLLPLSKLSNSGSSTLSSLPPSSDDSSENGVLRSSAVKLPISSASWAQLSTKRAPSAHADGFSPPTSNTRTVEGNQHDVLPETQIPTRAERPTESGTSYFRQNTGSSLNLPGVPELHNEPATNHEEPRVIEAILLHKSLEQSRDYGQGKYRPFTWHSPASWNSDRRTSGYDVLSSHDSSHRTTQGFSPKPSSSADVLNGRSPDPLVDRSKEVRHSVSISSMTTRSTEMAGSEHDLGLTRSRTMYWLKDMISGGQSPAPRLTARPSRSHGDFNEAIAPQRASTTPIKYLRQSSSTISRSKGTVSKKGDLSQDPHISEKFTKTIDDLELLLGEALIIAREAAERKGAERVPALLEDTGVMPHHGSGIDRNSKQDDTQLSVPLDLDEPIQLPSNPPLLNVDFLSHDASRAPESSTTGIGLNMPLDVTVIDRQGSRASSVMAKGSSDQVTVPLIADDDNHFETFVGQSEPKSDLLLPLRNMSFPSKKLSRKALYVEDDPHVIRAKPIDMVVPNQREVREYIRLFRQPPIHNRLSSLALRNLDTVSKGTAKMQTSKTTAIDVGQRFSAENLDAIRSLQSLDGPPGTTGSSGTEVDFATFQGGAGRTHTDIHGPKGANKPAEFEMKELAGDDSLPKRHVSGRRLKRPRDLASLKGISHVSIDDVNGFSLSRSHRRKPLARDWSPLRKRYVATIACISTAMIGIVVGIYAGEVPSIQYYIADLHHYAILGNVFFYIGLSIPVFIFWPLPLLHGRKPYILGAMAVAMPLLFPQAIMVGAERSPDRPRFRVGLILSRTLMGFALGFAQMNFLSILTDLFGASLQSVNPHQEVVNEYDVRRHGGGLGIWLGIWTWCYMGAIGLGFLIGAWVIENLSPDWGLYISIIIIAIVLVLNVITPEVRRSAYRRSVTEVRTPNDVSRRLARGEVMMHRLQTGPKWWGQEFFQGLLLSMDMLRQPGFLVMVVYVGWIYGQIILIIVLLGSLMSKLYHFKSPIVGVTTLTIPIGALLAIPFQKASIFSRARHHAQRTDSMTFEKRVTWSSHLVRRAIFTLILPFAGLAYTLSSGGPPTHYILPILFAGLIAFLSNLAIAECNGIVMETFDTSDLQPGMTGKPRGASGERLKHKRTNYSSFPRVSSAFSLMQGFGFLIAAGATGVGGVIQRNLGQRAATGVMAGILLFLTVLLLAVLVRWKVVQIIPTVQTGDMEMWERKRRESVKKLEEERKLGRGDSWNTTRGLENGDDPWRPVIIGNPSGKTRRLSILELGHLTRWSEIRVKNRLIDQEGYEAKHPNLATLNSVRGKLQETNLGSFRRKKRAGVGSDSSNMSEIEMVNNDLGQRAKGREGV